MVELYKKKSPAYFKARRERKVENLLKSKAFSSDPLVYRSICTKLESNRSEDFETYTERHFQTFRANLIYIQQHSGLSILEFSAAANISNHLISDKNLFHLATFPIHTFIKCYSVMRFYIETIDFCDIFTIDFKQAFPWLKDQEQQNRIKLGKKPRKTYTYKK